MDAELNAPAPPIPWWKRPALWLRRAYDWTVGWAYKPGGEIALFCIAFAESSFFPVPPDVLQIALSMGAPKRSFRFATVSGAGSVLGGMLGYLIGYALWQGVKGIFIPYVFSQATFDKVVQLYQDNAFLAVFTAAFTPIPYKVFTITAGVTEISFWMLVAGSLAGRFGRFYAVATVLYLFGPAAKEFIEKRFELLTLVFTVLLIGSFFLVKYVL